MRRILGVGWNLNLHKLCRRDDAAKSRGFFSVYFKQSQNYIAMQSSRVDTCKQKLEATYTWSVNPVI